MALRAMKTRKLIIALAAFSLVLVLIDGGEHLLKAKSAKLFLTITKAEDPYRDNLNETLRNNYESVASAAVTATALAFLIFFAARNKEQRVA